MPESYETDDDLVAGLKIGDEAAQLTFVQRYGPRMKKFLRVMPWSWRVRDEDIQEIVNDATYKVIESIDSFDARRGAFASWVLTITQRAGLDRLRQLQTGQGGFESGVESYEEILEETGVDVAVDTTEPAVLTPRSNVIRLSRAHVIARQAMKTLTPAEQQVLTEYMYGLASPEIAKVLKKKEGAVRTALSRAKKNFERECLRICQDRGIDPSELQS